MDSSSMTLKNYTILQNFCIMVVYIFPKFKQILAWETKVTKEETDPEGREITPSKCADL
jgi:hypothetical protein